MSINTQIEMQNKKNSPDEGNQDSHERILYLLEENMKMNKEIHKIVKKLRSHMFWQSVFGFLKVLIIVLPIVFGIWYLSPYIREMYAQYQQIVGFTEQAGTIDMKSLPAGVLDLLK